MMRISERWIWVVRYAVVIVLALVLGAALGEMALFKTTRLGKTGINAGHLAQFLGYGGALFVFWLLARRAAFEIDAKDPRWNAVKSILLPLATLVAVACAQAVALLVLGPLMSKAWHQAYNWVFIAAIMASAAWLVAALLTGTASRSGIFGGSGRMARRQEKASHRA